MSNPIPKRLKLPVHLVNGRWEFFYGGAVPVDNGTQAEMVIDSARITDKDFLHRVTQRVVSHCLSRGTRLMVALSIRTVPTGSRFWSPHSNDAQSIKVNLQHLPSESTRFVPVFLGSVTRPHTTQLFEEDGGLWMVVSGVGECELFSSSVDFEPELAMDSAQSLNHAFTMLSERFETHRLSHTGSVYSRVFYQESDNYWYPLEYLKGAALSRAEHKVMAAHWQAIEDQLGWCKFPRPDQAQ
jgi:hypothetical protein